MGEDVYIKSRNANMIDKLFNDMHDAGVTIINQVHRGVWVIKGDLPPTRQLTNFLAQRGYRPQFEDWENDLDGEDGIWFCDMEKEVFAAIYRTPGEPLTFCVS